MGKSIRKPFQGLINIITFNWHFYILAIVALLLLVFIQNYFPPLKFLAILGILFVVWAALVSLIVSTYIYDFSNLYTFDWLINLGDANCGTILNINAGFDETSHIIQDKFKPGQLMVADFFDKEKHTEPSIKRARKKYSPFPGTKFVTTNNIPYSDDSADQVFVLLSAHEIRDQQERVIFFKELRRVINPSGRIILTEHLRDATNFFAFNIGFLHFHSKKSWLKTIQSAELAVLEEIKVTPFITTFILAKNGNPS